MNLANFLKILLFIFTTIILPKAFSETVTGKVELVHLRSLNMMNVTISGTPAEEMYLKFLDWGYKVESCVNEDEIPVVTFITGPGFGCSKKGLEFSCTATLSSTFIEADRIVCPLPSKGFLRHP